MIEGKYKLLIVLGLVVGLFIGGYFGHQKGYDDGYIDGISTMKNHILDNLDSGSFGFSVGHSFHVFNFEHYYSYNLKSYDREDYVANKNWTYSVKEQYEKEVAYFHTFLTSNISYLEDTLKYFNNSNNPGGYFDKWDITTKNNFITEKEFCIKIVTNALTISNQKNIPISNSNKTELINKCYEINLYDEYLSDERLREYLVIPNNNWVEQTEENIIFVSEDNITFVSYGTPTWLENSSTDWCNGTNNNYYCNTMDIEDMWSLWEDYILSINFSEVTIISGDEQNEQ